MTQGPTAARGRSWRPWDWGRLLWLQAGGLFLAGWMVDRWLIDAGVWGRVAFTDTPVYFDFVSKLLAGKVPYRDFAVGYPPFAWPAFLAPAVLPAALRDAATYADMFAVWMAVVGTALAMLAARTSEALGHSRRRTLLVATAVGAAPALLGTIAPTHFDLWPSTLLCAALLLHVIGRRRSSAAVLGLAAAAKVYPAVLVPLLAFDVLRGGGRRALVVWAIVLVGGAVVPCVPFALWAPRGVLDPLLAQLARPLQVESLGAAIMLAAHWTAGLPVAMASSFGSQNLVGELADVIKQDLHGLAVVGLLWTCAWYARGGGGTGRLARAVALALAITVATDSTLSPQYMLWLVPAAFLVPGRRGIVALAVVVAAFGLTSTYFPTGYFELVRLQSVRPVWILLARDCALVALVGVLAVPGVRRMPTGSGTGGGGQ